MLSLVRPAGDEFMPWTGLLVGAPILGFYFWANNQFMVQRVLGAKDLNHGRWGALFAGLLKLPVIFIMVLPGTAAILLFSDLDLSFLNYVLPSGEVCTNLKDCPNMTYPVLLFNLLPKGILGLVLAGLLAAMMSSVSATFNSASTLVTMDFVTKLRPDLSSQQLVRVGQITTLVLVLLASAWAPQIERFSSLWEYLQRVLAFICPPVVAVFVLGLFWKKANATGAITSLLSGFVLALFLVLSTVYDLAPALNEIHFLHMAFYLFLFCGMIHVVVSLSTAPPPADKVAEYTWSRSMLAAESEELKALPWYQNYRILSVILLVITVLIVGYFW